MVIEVKEIKMTKQLEVLRSKEDQELVVAYQGIDLDSYEDPETMWNDFIKSSEADI